MQPHQQMKTRFFLFTSLQLQTHQVINKQLMLSLWIIVAALLGHSALAGPRIFKNAAGKELLAEAVSHDGSGSVQLKLSDGKLVQVKSSSLSPDDQKYLEEWMKANPPKVNYQFEIKASPKKVSGTRSNVGGYKNVKNELWTYEVSISNRSRQTVSGLKADFRVFVIDAADGRFAKSEGTTEGFVSGSAAFKKELRFNEAFEFTTGETKIDKVTYDWYSSRDESYKDALRGLMIRIKDAAGNVVYEYVSSNVSLKGKTWDSIPASREIKPEVN
jgi:hypothetical protein